MVSTKPSRGSFSFAARSGSPFSSSETSARVAAWRASRRSCGSNDPMRVSSSGSRSGRRQVVGVGVELRVPASPLRGESEGPIANSLHIPESLPQPAPLNCDAGVEYVVPCESGRSSPVGRG